MNLSPHKKNPSSDTSDHELESFMKEEGSNLSRDKKHTSISDTINTLPMSSLEGYFIFDLVKNDIVEQRGLADMFECDQERIDLNSILQRLASDEYADVSVILKEVFSQLIHATIPTGKSYLKICFHLVSCKGKKIGIISDNIVYSSDLKERPISVLVKFLRVDFIKPSFTVDWWVDPVYLDRERIDESLDKGTSGLFTQRELEVMKLLISNKSPAQIAQEFCLSDHTVVTHKKNIFAKSGCHSLKELKQFCLRERIFLDT